MRDSSYESLLLSARAEIERLTLTSESLQVENRLLRESSYELLERLNAAEASITEQAKEIERLNEMLRWSMMVRRLAD